MSRNRKPGAGPDELLDELTSLQSLLGDAAHDVPLASTDDDDIPLLPPDDGDEGDLASQIPLLEPAPEQRPDRQAMLRRAALARDNPFLAAARNATARSTPTPPAPPAPAAPPAAPAARRPTLDESAMRALVDELLAQWLPRIERELRARLMEELRRQQD